MSKTFLVNHDFETISTQYQLANVTLAGTGVALGPQNSGLLVALNSTSGSANSLPYPTLGATFEFVVNSTSSAHSIVAPLACIVGSLSNSTSGPLSANATPKTVITSGVLGNVGDRVRLISDGTYFYMSGSNSAYNGWSLS